MPTSRSAGSGTVAISVDEVAETADALDDRDENQRKEERDHRHGGERRRETALEKAQDLHGNRRLARPGEENGQVHVGERVDEREHGTGDDAGFDQREYDVAQ